MTEQEIKSIELDIKEYCSSVLVDELGYASPHEVRALYRYHLEALAHSLTVAFRIPAQVLQQNTVVARYPASLWQHIKKALGLRHRNVEIRINEVLVYPTVRIPEPLRGDSIRLHTNINRVVED